jgi:hypothetical protein
LGASHALPFGRHALRSKPAIDLGTLAASELFGIAATVCDLPFGRSGAMGRIFRSVTPLHRRNEQNAANPTNRISSSEAI